MEDTPSTMRNYLEQVPRPRKPERAVVELVAPKQGAESGASVVTKAPAQDPVSSTDPAWFRFSSGTDGSLAHQEFVLRVNGRDYEGARVILATATSGDAMSAVLGGLGAHGTLMVLGAGGPISVPPFLLITGARSVEGWYAGTAIDSQDGLSFSVLHGVRSMNEVLPLERVNEAYERMMSGKARFRVVLTTGD